MKKNILIFIILSIISYGTYSLSQGLAPKLGHLENKDLIELSGLAVSREDNNLLWAINDSGNEPDLFALDASGRDLGKIRIENVENTDWEAIASGPCEFSNSCIFIADIGDNRAKRDELQIHIIVEPKVGVNSVSPSKTLKFRFPNAAHDAESLMVNPKDGTIYLIEKKLFKEKSLKQRIFKLIEDKNLSEGKNAYLVEFAQISANFSPNEYIGSITDATFDDNGEYFYFRDYENVYKSKQQLQEGKIIDAIKLDNVQLKQGESIAKIPNSESLIVSSEGKNEAIFVLPINVFSVK